MAEIDSKNNDHQNPSREQSADKRLRLHYLDGLRGLAALYVVFSHAWELQGNDLPILWLNFSKIFRYGSFSVSIFIVLSGYCLMLPVVRSQTGYISGSLIDYFKRRAIRILPPYYAALIISIALGLLITFLAKLQLFPWDYQLWGHFSPQFSISDVLTHLFLVHNLTPGQRLYNINGPMWSVATEWQIYFLFPMILLPIWRRWGIIIAVAIAFFFGLIPHYFLNHLIESACPWYLGLFALGMAAAEIGFSQKQSFIHFKKSLPWGLFAFGTAVLAILAERVQFGLDKWISDSLAGLATAFLLVYCTQIIAENKKKSLTLSILQSPVAIVLGTFSYSLYLIHVLVMTPLNQYLHSLSISSIKMATLLYLISIPISLCIAYLFYIVFERPFMSNFLKKRKVKSVILHEKNSQ
ncbi:acyltransferase 3 [Calothrix sp. NIES-4101]|nr:acyltransferase 3 [Calothrix sp. NIES-4101]